MRSDIITDQRMEKKITSLSNMKAFCRRQIVILNLRLAHVLGMVENIVEKEKLLDTAFSTFQTMFLKDHIKLRNVWLRII